MCQYSLSKRTTFVCALPPRNVFRRSKCPCRHCPGSLCCLNPFGTCLGFLLNIRADHSTTVCVLQQPYNQQSPCSATPLWKQRFDIGSTHLTPGGHTKPGPLLGQRVVEQTQTVQHITVAHG